MSDFKKELDTDTGDVESHRFLEIPISGPGSANRLVTITGIAIPDADISDGNKPANELIHGDIFIKTDYRLRDTDKWQGIVHRNTTLLAATYASLASITYDEEVDDFTAAVDSVDATVDTDGRIRVHMVVGLQGDTTIHRISYQTNILVQKAG
jgi:hypothetical protein